MKIRELVLTSGLAVVSLLSAGTIAQWPLEWDAERGRIDGRCLIDGANDLSHDTRLVYDWARLDRAPFADGPRTVVYSRGSATAASYVSSETLARHVRPDRDFTIEGWYRFPSLPDSGKTFFVVDCDGAVSGGGDQRWFLTFRNRSGMDTTGVSWQLFAPAHGIPDTLLYHLTDAETAEVTRGWHHFALTCRHADARQDGKPVWRLYLDGVQKGAAIGSAPYAGTPKGNGYFGLGGRNVAGNVFTGALANCRLSDAALEPTDFLNAVRAPAVRAFWRLGRTAEDAVDGSPAVGRAHLGCGFLQYRSSQAVPPGYSDSLMSADADCAFVGNPPNTTVALPDGNRGSLLSRQASVRSTLRMDGIGQSLSLTNDFTVEGWVKPECRDSAGFGAWRHLCGTRLSQYGWVFQLHDTGSALMASLHANSVNEGALFPSAIDLVDISEHDGKWVHLALVYSSAGGARGNGLWRCYVNGVLGGERENERKPTDGGFNTAEVSSGCLKFGTVNSNKGTAFPGKLDCWRASRAALRPEQLLCATPGEAAPETVALWPFNAQRGVGADFADVLGTYSFQQPYEPNNLVTAADDAPDAPGVSVPANGSVSFRTASGGGRAYLMSDDPSVLEAFQDANGYTAEFYVKRTAEPTSTEFFLFMYSKVSSLSVMQNCCLNFQYRKDTGFWFFVDAVTNGDKQFKDASGQPILLARDVWTHVALAARRADNAWTYDLYLDGVKRGSLSGTGVSALTPKLLLVGGRPSTDNSLFGQLSCLRITQGRPVPADFLCSGAVAAKLTTAYWPLDAANGTLDLANRVHGADGACGFSATAGVTGVDAGARRSVPRPDSSADLDGDSRTNVGAIRLKPGTSALALHVGAETDVDGPFTVEGWLNWTPPMAGAREVVAGTYRPAASIRGGWRLVLDSTGDRPVLRVLAKGTRPVNVFADGVLLPDATPLAGGWHHLALRYDPSLGHGTWSLLLDGQPAGTAVENDWTPMTTIYRPTFLLGAEATDPDHVSCAADYDMWRISRGVLGRDELLWDLPRGTQLLVR